MATTFRTNMHKQYFEYWTAAGTTTEVDWTGHMKIGDRVKFRDGYASPIPKDNRDRVLLYRGKDSSEAGMVCVGYGVDDYFGNYNVIPESIELYPWTRDERIQDAIDTVKALGNGRLTSIALAAVLDDLL